MQVMSLLGGPARIMLGLENLVESIIPKRAVTRCITWVAADDAVTVDNFSDLCSDLKTTTDLSILRCSFLLQLVSCRL